ncbi:MAG TPA: tetratricopeptide repeat protein [bacterium]|nr:tetratricopeptide repeat protein [bacterium]HQG44927.1 tetratricopeptide repeat protein [bacterium]HQI48103.1 tetratricopeptide repeat protein [bacterium]HQJ64499.1 tetratricopeptide repeat protein [bacterium]
MKHWIAWTLALVMVAILAGCGEKMTEEQLRANAADFESREQWKQAVEMYARLVKAFPKSPRADETLYRLGVLYANNLKDYQQSVDAYKQLIRKYPKSNYVIQSSFMIGYRYANDIKDYDNAKKYYQEFLQKWPNHELASSVKWELEHLGKDISELDLQLGTPAPGSAAKQ